MSIIYNIIITPIELIFDAIFSPLSAKPGVAIILISIVMKMLALPLYKRADNMQEEENKKVASMSKWVKHIKKTFKGDERYMMLTRYYKQENYRPTYALKSAFPLLLQIPFFIAAYHYLSNQTLLCGMSCLFIKDLGTPDQLLTVGSITINVLPIVMTLINLVSAFIYLKGATMSSKIQTYGIAVLFLVLLYNSPAGLVFYWTLNQIFSVSKNVFLKLLKDKKKQNIGFFCIGIICVVALACFGSSLGIKNKKVVAACIMLISMLPLVCSIIKSKWEKTKCVRF